MNQIDDSGQNENLGQRFVFVKVVWPVPGFDVYDTSKEHQFPFPIMAHCSNVLDARMICDALNDYF